MKQDDLEFLTVVQVSAKLQVHWQTVLNYVRRKQLNAVRIGNGYRISKKDFADFISKRSTKKGKM